MDKLKPFHHAIINYKARDWYDNRVISDDFIADASPPLMRHIERERSYRRRADECLDMAYELYDGAAQTHLRLTEAETEILQWCYDIGTASPIVREHQAQQGKRIVNAMVQASGFDYQWALYESALVDVGEYEAIASEHRRSVAQWYAYVPLGNDGIFYSRHTPPHDGIASPYADTRNRGQVSAHQNKLRLLTDRRFELRALVNQALADCKCSLSTYTARQLRESAHIHKHDDYTQHISELRRIDAGYAQLADMVDRAGVH